MAETYDPKVFAPAIPTMYLLRGLSAENGGKFALNGQDAELTFDLSGNYVVTAGQGTFTLSGQDTEFLRALIMAAGQGSFTLTGQDAALLFGYGLQMGQGSFALTGQDIAFQRALFMDAAQGSFVLSGQATDLDRGYLVTAAQGSFTLSGQAVTLTFDEGGIELTHVAGSSYVAGDIVIGCGGHYSSTSGTTPGVIYEAGYTSINGAQSSVVSEGGSSRIAATAGYFIAGSSGTAAYNPYEAGYGAGTTHGDVIILRPSASVASIDILSSGAAANHAGTASNPTINPTGIAESEAGILMVCGFGPNTSPTSVSDTNSDGVSLTATGSDDGTQGITIGRYLKNSGDAALADTSHVLATAYNPEVQIGFALRVNAA